MSNLLKMYNAAPKGDNFRMIANPVKYVGYILYDIARKGRLNVNAATQVKSNPSATIAPDNTKGNMPKD